MWYRNQSQLKWEAEEMEYFFVQYQGIESLYLSMQRAYAVIIPVLSGLGY